MVNHRLVLERKRTGSIVPPWLKAVDRVTSQIS
jgi:hypothetical protein